MGHSIIVRAMSAGAGGLVSVSVLAGSVLAGSGQPVQAQSVEQAEQLSVALNVLPGESYDAFIERAEAETQLQVESYFQRTAADSVMVTFNGNNEGLIAPVLELAVTREQWAAAPQTKRWATYFLDSDVLLGLADPAPQPNPAIAEDGTAGSDGIAGEPTEDPGAASAEGSTTTTISVPTDDGGSITPTAEDGSTGDDAVQPQTSSTTPTSEAAPFEATPEAGTTNNSDVVDFEDSNDFEIVPDSNDGDLTNEDGAIQPQTSTTEDNSDDVRVIGE
ncbi:MAG: hypothetical protein WBA10_11730 [Elainellaceae cyanobacterium]